MRTSLPPCAAAVPSESERILSEKEQQLAIPAYRVTTWESRLAKRASRLRGPCTPMHNSTSCRRDATASAASSCCLLQAVPRPARARLRFRGWFDLCGVGIGQRLCCRLLCGRNVNFDCSFFFLILRGEKTNKQAQARFQIER